MPLPAINDSEVKKVALFRAGGLTLLLWSRTNGAWRVLTHCRRPSHLHATAPSRSDTRTGTVWEKSFTSNSVLPQLVVVLLLIFTAMSRSVPGVRGASPLYAKPSATGAGNCATWDDACTLQTALAQAVSGEEIWVAAGVHYPGSAREDSFALRNGVQVFGGFAGSETLLSQRDWISNTTTLSADLDQDGTTANNAYHVLIGIGADATAVFDGFTITAGYADFASSYHTLGAGVYLSLGSPTLTNLSINANTSASNGAGLYNDRSAATLTNIAFRGNAAGGDGGGMYNHAADPVLSNVLFSGNYAAYGGGFATDGGAPQLINATLSGNRAYYAGGALYVGGGAPVLANGIVWNNNATLNGSGLTVSNSIFQGGFAGTGILDVDPLFEAPQSPGSAPTTAGDYRPRSRPPLASTRAAMSP